MYNEFDHNKDFSKGFKILHKQDIGNWSNIGSLDESDFDFFDFLFRRTAVTETPTQKEPDGSTLICGNSYFNNNRVISIYFNGVDLCDTPPDEIAEPATPAPQPNVIGRQVLRIDTRLNSPIGSNTPFTIFTSGISLRSFELDINGASTFDVDWGGNVVGSRTATYRRANSGSISYRKGGIYDVTVSARSAFGLQYKDIGGFGNCLLSVSYPDAAFTALTNLNSSYFGCINLRTVNFPQLDQFNRPYGKSLVSLNSSFEGCTSLTSIGFFDTSSVLSWRSTFAGCSSLQSLPNLDYTRGSRFPKTFKDSGLVKWDAARPFSEVGIEFQDTWSGCSNLKDFPPGMFDNIFQNSVNAFARGNPSLGASGFTQLQRMRGAFQGCALTPTSIENILVSLTKTKFKDGTPSEYIGIDISGGTNAGKSTWTANAISAYNTLIGRNWQITFNP